MSGRTPAVKRLGAIGDFIDATLPDSIADTLPARIADTLPAEVDREPFLLWLAQRMGNYRFEEMVRDKMPSATEEYKWILGLLKSLQHVRQHLSPGAMPPRARRLLTREAYTIGEDVDDLALNVDKLLALVEQLAASAPLPARKGRKPLSNRDRLLAEVIQHLQGHGLAGERAAREVAEQLLVALRVPVPAGEASVRRATKAPSRNSRRID